MFRLKDCVTPAVLLALAVAGPFLPLWLVSMGTLALANGLVVLGLIVLWRAGLISFGQALYYALGAYTVALVLLVLPGMDAIVLILLAMVSGGVLAFVIGFLIARYREIFFAMLTLALSMILYGILVKTEALGSTDGFNVGEFTIFGFSVDGETRTFAIYWLALAFAALATVLVSAYLRSVAGSAAVPLRENEIRVEYLGVSVNRIVHLKVVIAGILAGAGGALAALSIGHVDPNMSFWTTSGGFVFVAILAGAASVTGAFVGAFIFEVIRTIALALFPGGWQLILGGVLLAVILFMPSGIGVLLSRRRSGRITKPASGPPGTEGPAPTTGAGA